jgi:mannosyl-glycoprotein endo-beta-N-acetylglucosaminidase
VNIENPLPRAQVANVLHFLARLRALLRQGVGPRAEVIWYDAVAASGRLRRQSELVPSNAPFFDACDGIFLDYKWKGEGLLRSAAAARGRWVGARAHGRGPDVGASRAPSGHNVVNLRVHT